MKVEGKGADAKGAKGKGDGSKRRMCDRLGAALLAADRLLTPLESALVGGS